MTNAMLFEKIREYCEKVLAGKEDDWVYGYFAGMESVANGVLDLMGRDQ